MAGLKYLLICCTGTVVSTLKVMVCMISFMNQFLDLKLSSITFTLEYGTSTQVLVVVPVLIIQYR